MNKTAIIVVGSLAVLGIGAFFLFKSKANPNVSGTAGSGLTNNSGANTSGSSSASNNNSGTLGSGSGATNNTSSQTDNKPKDTVLNTAPITNPNAPITQAQSAQNTEALAVYSQAQALASQVYNLKSQKKPIIFGGDSSNFSYNQLLDMQIIQLVNTLKTLGYKEVNGIAQKI